MRLLDEKCHAPRDGDAVEHHPIEICLDLVVPHVSGGLENQESRAERRRSPCTAANGEDVPGKPISGAPGG